MTLILGIISTPKVQGIVTDIAHKANGPLSLRLSNEINMKEHSLEDLVNELQNLVTSCELPKDVRKQACSLAHQLWLDLEDPGDIVTRVVFHVYASVLELMEDTNH